VIQEFVNADEIVVICGQEQLDWRKMLLAVTALESFSLGSLAFPKSSLDETESLSAIHDSYEGAMGYHTIASLRSKVYGYFGPIYTIMVGGFLDENDTTIPAVDLKHNGLRSDAIRRDFGGLEEYDRLMRPLMLHFRALGQMSPEKRPDLVQLFYETTHFLATKPLDRMYALLGLTGDPEEPTFAPTYSENDTVEAVCQRFAVALIQKGQCGVILAMAGNIAQACKERRNMPSWVPDWTITIRLRDRHLSMCYMMDMYRKSEKPADVEVADQNEKRLYRAALASTTRFRFEGQDSLVVEGFRVATITTVLPSHLVQSIHIHEQMVESKIKTYPTGESIEEAVWKTLIANRTIRMEKAPASYLIQYRIAKTTRAAPGSIGTTECSDYLQSFTHAANNCTLGVLSEGYIGLLPQRVKIGDIIAIFHGCDAPFVLRPAGAEGHFQLVGECYIHGIMEGEVFGDPRFVIQDIFLH
jgi:hypothetical protein